MDIIQEIVNDTPFSNLFEQESRIRELYQFKEYLEIRGELTPAILKAIKLKILLIKENCKPIYEEVKNDFELWEDFHMVIADINLFSASCNMDVILNQVPFNRFIRISTLCGSPPKMDWMADDLADDEMDSYYQTDILYDMLDNLIKAQGYIHNKALSAVESEMFRRAYIDIQKYLKKRKNKTPKRIPKIKLGNQILYYTNSLEEAFLYDERIDELDFIEEYYRNNIIKLGSEEFPSKGCEQLAVKEYHNLLKETLKFSSSVHNDDEKDDMLSIYLKAFHSYSPDEAIDIVKRFMGKTKDERAKRKIEELHNSWTLKKAPKKKQKNAK